MRPRKKNEGLPYRVYERFGRFRYSIRYNANKDTSNIAGFCLSCDVKDVVEIERIRKMAIVKVVKSQGEVVTGFTLKDGFDQYFSWQYGLEKDHPSRKQNITLKGNEQEKKKLLDLFGTTAPEHVTGKAVSMYMHAREQEGAASKANKELALLSGVFNYLMRIGLAESNPCIGIAQNKSKPKNKVIHPDLLELFIEEGRNQGGSLEVLTLALELAYATTSRADEIRYLKRANFREDVLIVPVGKIGNKSKKMDKQYVVEGEIARIRRRLIEILPESDYVFCTSKGDAYSRSGWGSNWKRLKAKVREVALKKNIPWVEFSLTDMRPASVTDRLRAGESIKQVMDSTGHRSERMINEKYNLATTRNVVPLIRKNRDDAY
jgi:site-specific recombinase XerD